ncbi:hypothetical protein [Amycolatopsis taiwanensis]|uniref:hypothetical protein n=1 Tax=Amycolatopsis taiwanensis TaxID=342230 RepID=UPI000484CC50|nr:hypothetical protein [Amycolatopsis taiwanensis]
MTVSRRLIVIVAAAVVVLAGAATAVIIALKPSEPDTFTVQGALSCPGRLVCSGYTDIVPGAQVEVLNQANKVLAVGQLRLANDGRRTGNGGLDVPDYTFTIPGVPRGEHLYGVHVGNANRGIIWEPEDQAVNSGFVLTLGS